MTVLSGSEQLVTEGEKTLPHLRQDLSIISGAPGEDGAPTWLLYDPLKNSYYKLGKIAFFLLSKWQGGADQINWVAQLNTQARSIDNQDIQRLLEFLTANNLLRCEGEKNTRSLDHLRKRAQGNRLKWILTRYLFIRIPIFKPDAFLSKTLPAVEMLFHPRLKTAILLLGLLGILLIIRQWDQFMATIMHFFNVKGALYFALTLFFVKVFHELGHAYSAKRLGCRIPSMGITLLVLYPFLYTDTTDSWRLTSKKERLEIVTAGVKAELVLALIATFTWSFLDTGVLKSIAFFVATTGWITSLAINMSPFMRFDGYYALSDILGVENLQQRAFNLARWQLRRLLFGIDDPAPEAIPNIRKKALIFYAYATWLYRFFLFLGIALLVYHFTFKLLGVILFIVEIFYFIVVPICNELKTWWVLRRKLSINGNTVVTSVLLLLLLSLLFLPWQSSLLAPAILETKNKIDVYPTEAGLLQTVHIKKGQYVEKGDKLFTLSFPDLEFSKTLATKRITALQTRINRHAGSKVDLQNLEILQKELAKEVTTLKGIENRISRGIVHSSMDGRVSYLLPGKGKQWVAASEKIVQLTGPIKNHLIAYIPETEIHLIHEKMEALFTSDSGEVVKLKGGVTRVSEVAVSTLDHPELASIFGGPIAVGEERYSALRPEEGIYRVELQTDTPAENIPWRIMGQVRLKTAPQSPVLKVWQYAVSVLIRESGM